ncbi:MAG: Amino acid adenylation domain protein, partial [Nonomuraea muscovyensis]|nr:Amino acid adenylation domain protein [Nonomuraea muscovyensis]
MSVVDLSAAKQELLRRRLRGRAAEREIPRRPEDAAPVLSPAQEPLWFMEHFTPGTATYTIALAVRLRGPIDHDRLEAALALLPERHESLRHRFPATDDGLPAVHVVAGTGVPLGRAQAAPAGLADAEIAALIDAETAIPLDLADGPLLRALLVEDGAGEHVLALLVHHIVADGRSAQLLMRDLLSFYRGEDPPAPAVRFGDVAAWQRERTFERELAFWKDELAGLPRAELPADRARPARQSFD